MSKIVSSDRAYAYIRERIINGEYPTGYSLTTHTLSAKIGVSRTPVRDALRQLEADGLVEISAHIGASVKSMEMIEFTEMCELRLALEAHAAGLAATRHTEVDLQAIRFPLEGMRGLTERLISTGNEQPYLRDLIREDVRFHVAIMAAAKNDLIKKEILRFHLINRIVSGQEPAESAVGSAGIKIAPEKRAAVLASHIAIYEAIQRRDAGAAKEAMERHIQDIIDATMRTVARNDDRLIAKDLTEEELVYIS